MIRVVIVDDHIIVRSGLEHLLATTDDIELVGAVADGSEVAAMVARKRPDVVLMDLSMPGVDGVEAIKRLVAAGEECRILVLTSFSDQSRITDALNAGADGYILKHSDPDQIVQAIRAVHDGESPLDPKAARVLLDRRKVAGPLAEMTEREREVLRLVSEGLSNRQIARQLDITERTVKAHLSRIFQRIEVTDRTQAALWASRNLPPH